MQLKVDHSGNHSGWSYCCPYKLVRSRHWALAQYLSQAKPATALTELHLSACLSELVKNASKYFQTTSP
eukprot:742269-Amphidinium_carterae.1